MSGKGTGTVMIGAGIGSCLLGALLTGGLLLAIIRITHREDAPRCHPPLGNLSEATLAGTWVKGVPSHKDTLIIRADGTYKQIVHIEFPRHPTLDYESGWQPWRLEYSQDNIPYVHLTGYAFCGMNPDIPCDKRDGDGYDFCEDKSIRMNGEGILVVVETWEEKPGGAGRQYFYSLFYPLGSENSYGYSLQEP